MKKMSLLPKSTNQYFNKLLIVMLLTFTALSIPEDFAFAAPGDPPTINIESPATNVLLNKADVVVSGTYIDDNVQPSDLIFTAYDKAIATDPDVIISDSSTNAVDWNLSKSVPNGTWTFNKTLSEGIHILTIEIKEKTGTSFVEQSSVSFTIDTKRPYISGTGVLLSDATIRAGEDLTSVPLDSKIRFTVADDKQMTQLVNKINDSTSPYNPIKVVLGSAANTTPTPLNGTAIIEDKGLQSGKYVYDITFTPSQPLALNQSYLAYMDSGLLDDSNGPIYAKFFKFTTKTNTAWDDPDEQNHSSSNPHGHYQLNTNMCASCHSTHVDSPFDKVNDSSNPSNREGGSYLIDFNDKLKDPSENYCMACHDGTINAPIIDGINKTYHHNNPVDYSQTGTNNLKEATSCTSCHNPHIDWSESNQNLLKDHYVYTHQAVDVGKNGLTSAVVDSLDLECRTCHDDYLIHDTTTNTVTSIFDPSSSDYKVLSYFKSMTATGSISSKITDPTQNTVSDYSLCLRCHNSKNANTTNIEQYYTQTNSGHYFALPSGETTHADGSTLNGPIPCAECHQTHGSNNIKMLREKLGNDPNVELFSTQNTTWAASDERTFCLRCHNNNTEIYGKTGIFNTNNSEGVPITGHQVTDTQACSYCHGGLTRSAIEAAHSPKVTQP